jgi:hypothetical protein
VRWDTHSVPEYGDRPQAILNRRLVADCDILIGAFWTRLGTPTGDFDSGTVEEIHEFTRSGKPVLLYFSSRHVDLDQVDFAQVQRVREFRAQFERLALVDKFSDTGDLRYKLNRHLQQQVRRLHDNPAGTAGHAREVVEPAMQPHVATSEPSSGSMQHLDGAASDKLYLEYWERFADAIRESDVSLRPPTPSSRNYARLSLASSDMRLNAYTSVRDRFIGVELVLKRPACDGAFSRLKSAQAAIEQELGRPLEWNQLPSSYRIVLVERGFDPAKRVDWPRQHALLIDRLKGYQESLLKRIADGNARNYVGLGL